MPLYWTTKATSFTNSVAPFPLRSGGRPHPGVTVTRHTVYLFLSLALAWLLAGCQQEATPATPGLPTFQPLSEFLGTPVATVPPLPTLGADEVAQGRVVYVENCSVCHGANLEGHPNWKAYNEDGSFRPPPHDATGHTWHHGDSLLIETIRLGGGRLTGNLAGLSNMPAFGEVLSDEEITAVLAYIKSTWPDETRQFQWEATVTMENQ